MTRKASIKETGEELSQAEWERFDAAVAEIQAERPRGELPKGELPKGELPKGERPEGPGVRSEADRVEDASQ